jgi:DNA primase
MDVIALHQAGFTAAIAPLGTALTEDHLAELWRLDPVPILCFDGDAAGARAAERTMMLALPLLKPEQSLQIARLPANQDPDSLIRQHGKAAFQAVLDAAAPFVDALYAALAQGAGTAPEQRAALRTRLQTAAAAIGDRALAYEFKTALLAKFFQTRRNPQKPPPPRPPRTPIEPESIAAERARLLTAIILRHPGILHDVEEAYAGLALAPDLVRLREHILQLDDAALLDSPTLLAHLTQSGTAEQAATVLSAALPSAACARPEAMPAEAEAEWWHIFGLMHRSGLQDELASARHAFAAAPDEASQRRLVALSTALAALTDPDGEPEP